MFCRCCGAPIDKYDKFCIHCGERVIPVTQNSQPTVQPAEQFNYQKKEAGWSLVIGIIGLVMTFSQPLIGFILGIIAIVRSNKEKQKAALVLGIIAIVIGCMRFFTGIIAQSFIDEILFEFSLLI